MSESGPSPGAPVVYVLKRFPRLSETFVLRELLSLEAQGQRLLVDALLPPEPGPRHPELDDLRAEVRYLPRRPRLRHVAGAHGRLFVRHPQRWVREARRARRHGTWRRFLQAGLVAERARMAEASHIHAHFATAATEVAGHAAALADLTFSVTAHAKDVFHADNQSLLRRRVHGAAAVVTVSRFNTAHLIRELPGMHVMHVPNGIPMPAPLVPRPEGPVLCIGRLVPKKGIDTLVRAAALLDPAVSVEIVGGGPLGEELAKLAADLGAAARVCFLGPQPSSAVEAALTRCSMVVLPCRIAANGDRDGLPTALLEAMARGIPVISTPVVGIPEIVRDEETGLLVPPDDPEALAAAISRLRRDPALGRRLGAAGRALVGAEFDPAGSAAALRSIFSASGQR